MDIDIIGGDEDIIKEMKADDKLKELNEDIEIYKVLIRQLKHKIKELEKLKNDMGALCILINPTWHNKLIDELILRYKISLDIIAGKFKSDLLNEHWFLYRINNCREPNETYEQSREKSLRILEKQRKDVLTFIKENK